MVSPHGVYFSYDNNNIIVTSNENQELGLQRNNQGT